MISLSENVGIDFQVETEENTALGCIAYEGLDMTDHFMILTGAKLGGKARGVPLFGEGVRIGRDASTERKQSGNDTISTIKINYKEKRIQS